MAEKLENAPCKEWADIEISIGSRKIHVKLLMDGSFGFWGKGKFNRFPDIPSVINYYLDVG